MNIKREVKELASGNFLVTVTPPAETGFSPSMITLNPNQYERYLGWLDGFGLIQDTFPDLTAEQREILQTGIGPEEWDKAFPDYDDDEPRI